MRAAGTLCPKYLMRSLTFLIPKTSKIINWWIGTRKWKNLSSHGEPQAELTPRT